MIHPMVLDLKQERERLDFPANWAGQRAGLSKNTVGQWERGERNPSLVEISQYAFSLGYALTSRPSRRCSVATSEQIAAAAHQVNPGRGDGFVDRKAHHILGGAFTGDDLKQARAARHVLRFAPDPGQAADALGLTLPPGDDPAGPLVQLAARDDTHGARTWLDSRTLTEVSAIRAALGRRDR